MCNPSLLWTLLLLFSSIFLVHAIIPTGHLKFEDEQQLEQYTRNYDTSPMYAAPAFWARGLPPEHTAVYRRLVLPHGNTTGCMAVLKDPLATPDNFFLLAERGECSFEHKGLQAQKLGALGLIVYNTLKGIYRNRRHADPDDYDCNRGQAWFDLDAKSGDAAGSRYKDLPVWHDNITSHMSDLCTKSPSCESQRCLLTNITDEKNGTKVCCAWDLFIEMGPDQPAPPSNQTSLLQSQEQKLLQSELIEKVGIPVVFVTMHVGDRLLEFAQDRSQGLMGITMYQRPTPSLDLSSCMIWLIAMITIYTAADMISRKENTADVDVDSLSPSVDDIIHENDDGDDGDTANDNSSIGDIERADNRSTVNENGGDDDDNADIIDITPQSAMAFMLIASSTLLIFFFFDMHIVILCIYMMGATMSVALVFIYPKFLERETIGMSSAEVSKMLGRKSEGAMDWSMVSSLLIAAVITGIWFLNRHAAWSWIAQDFLGASVCLCFLSYIRLPNLKVATLLLSMAFCYDVFFVFITPYLFGSSVMVHVAEGHPNPVHADANFCEKYPNDPDCADTTAPNLLVVPSINDYRGGSCMLGLGDIILPGLFLVLVARIDVRQRGYLVNDDIFAGLFAIALIGYGLALILANEAVVFFQFGQPALLYIVPFMLLPVLWKCYQDKTLDKLWEHLPLMRTKARAVNEEQRLLLDANDDVLKASASWGESTGELNIKVRSGSSNNSRKRGISSGVTGSRSGGSHGNGLMDSSSHHGT